MIEETWEQAVRDDARVTTLHAQLQGLLFQSGILTQDELNVAVGHLRKQLYELGWESKLDEDEMTVLLVQRTWEPRPQRKLQA